MHVGKALVIIIGCLLMGGIIGASIGYVIGRFLPEAYRSLFSPVGPDFSPIAVGIHLGLTQGIFFGMLIGMFVVGVVTWFEVKTAASRNR